MQHEVLKEPHPSNWHAVSGGHAEDELSMLALGTMLLRHLRFVVLLALFTGVLAALVSLWRGNDYVATARVLPQLADTRSSNLASLAEQFGIRVGGSTGTASLDLYAEILRSRELLRRAAVSDFAVVGATGADTASKSLVELIGLQAESEDVRLAETISFLRERVSTQANAATGLITLETRMERPELAVALNRRLLDLLNEFNLRTRQSQARAERAFVQSRLAEAEAELLQAEEALERFLQRNRRAGDSPELRFESMRLQRQIDIRQQVYASLALAYEQARVEEVRNTPVVTVVDPPEGAVEPDGLGTIGNALVGLGVGLVLGLGIAFFRETMARQRRHNPEEYAEFEATRKNALRKLLPGSKTGR